MYYINLVAAKTSTPVLLFACFAIVVSTLILFRKLASNENKKMLETQAFALENPNQIEKIKLVEHREIFCVVTMTDKKPEIIAQGVQAVRVFDQLLAANPNLSK